MMKRSLRLKRGSDFNKLYKFGKSIHGENVLCRVMLNNLAESKLGVIVSKKISLKAVERNRIRRRINEIIRKNWSDIPVGYNILIIAKKTCLGISEKKLEKDILFTVKRALSK